MQPETWERLEAVFFGALELPAEQRGAYLDRACAGDAAFRVEVDAVLAAHVASGSGATHFDRLLPTGREPAAAGRMAGTRAGAYRLRELIGHGGMGEVYRAERVDDQFHREVAIKLLRSGLAHEVARRFALERQILARLEHPNIATLLDGGVNEDGQPYLVMQFVRGAPITEYAAERGLSIEERLRLFVTVCEAVQFAHANLVVHRDLKPSNILVTDQGEVRLLDFGIAKLLDPQGVGITAPITEELLLLTPDYAAPEQLRGEAITTATDVYALGVLLYELLTGSPPFRATSTAELQRVVCELEPARPSTRVRSVDRDLDDVVLMALRKEPERRYASAGQLGEDVARFLAGRPVIARPDTLGYRLRKFVRRNGLAVGAVTALIAILAGATALTAHQSQQRRVALAEAEKERDAAAEITDFVIGIFDVNDPSESRGQVVTARELLDRAAERIRVELEAQPVLRADLEMAIGRAYGKLGLLKTAAPLVEQGLQRRRDHLSRDHPDLAAGIEQLARLRASQGEFDVALELIGEAVGIYRAAPVDRRADIARNLALAGRIEIDLARFGAAREKLDAALEIQRALGDARAIATTLRGIGLLAIRQGRGEEALDVATEALAVARSAVEADDPFVYVFQEDLAIAFEGLGRAEEAAEIHRDMLESRQRVYGPDHPDVSFSLHNLGRVIGNQGRWNDALPLYARALEIRERRLRPDHPQIGHLLLSYAIATGMAGEPERAVGLLERTLGIYELSGDTEGVLLALEGLAMWNTLLERQDAALTALETAVERGYANLQRLSGRPFEMLADEPRFQRLLSEVRERLAEKQ